MHARTKTHHFEIKKCKNFLGRGHPSPNLTHLCPSIFAPIGRLSSTRHPPKKNPSYGLAAVAVATDCIQSLTDTMGIFCRE